MAEDPDDDAQEGLEIGMVPSPDGSPQRLSVTFGADDPIIINDENENIDVDMMASGQKSTTTTGGISSTHSGTSGQSSYADSRLSGLSSSMPVTNTRKASFIDRKAKWPRSLSEVHRQDHMNKLVAQRRQSMLQLFPEDESSAAIEEEEEEGQVVERKETMEDHSDFVKHLKGFLAKQGGLQSMPLPSMEIRLQNVSYRVPSLDDGSGKNKIPTIYNTSPLYSIQRFIKWLRANKEDRPSNQHLVTDVLTNVNLVLKPKCMYLVLGPPLSGKTSLLKAIAGMLQQDTFPKGYNEGKYLTGKILYNNLVVSGDDVDEKHRTLFKNLVAFVRQNDNHAPRLTVAETFLFSGNCKDERVRKNRKGTRKDGKVGLTLEGLGLSHVQDTFVGNEQIRGVSGGQRRRVTLGEMLIWDTPLLCGDEISTGLDTASTVDILRILSYHSRLLSRISVVSLLQPSPEAVALFDEVILLSEGGNIIFTGPTEAACGYFRNLGYEQPDSMDNADYLLAVASSDRKHLYRAETDMSNESEHGSSHTPASFARSLRESTIGSQILKEQEKSWEVDWATATQAPKELEPFRKKYQNSFWVSIWLTMKRAFVLWRRDYIFIRASVIKNIAMGLSVGFVFQNTDISRSFFGVLFQGNLFIMLGAMTSTPDKLDDRAIFYKHHDSNFYPALAYIIGQALALIPQMLLDVMLFGTFVYWMVGFVFSAAGFLIYLALFFSFNFTMGQLFGLLATMAPSKSVVSAGGAFILLLNTLFCGYIVAPAVIPAYWIWIYWIVPLSWVYRALLLNEFTSDDPLYADGVGDQILVSAGIVMPNGEPFGREWIAYCFAYLLPFLFLCMITSAACLTYFRMEPKIAATPDVSAETEDEKENSKTEGGRRCTLTDTAFIPVDLSFKNVSYEVKSSTGSDTLRLLNNVSGVFSAGRMCALMGESGAGKTTLMDVIALRKESGTITGDILLNGFPQESNSFRRCSGYVEQFDVQSAELTVRETIRFSAQLRLDPSNPVYDTPEGFEDHVTSIIETLELTREADVLVGSVEEGGLTFEQKKRLSIAVELAASPSIIFLDEPTSGLDARAALLVMTALKKICETGRTVVATIHQPSSAVFDMFDDLLLLKKGGETVFFGELGLCSCNLVSYFEGLGASRMDKGENPSTWMLNVLSEQIMIPNDNEEESKSIKESTERGNTNESCPEESSPVKKKKTFISMFRKSQENDDVLAPNTNDEDKNDNCGEEDSREKPLQFSKAWNESSNCTDLQRRLTEAAESPDEALEIKYDSEFAVPWYRRDNLMAKRLVTIYWRSPAYNLSRMVLGMVIALLLGSCFIPIRLNDTFTEPEMVSMLATIFIAFIIIGVLSMTSVIPVMLSIRDMYYRHKAAGMLGSRSVGRALASAEKRFILISTVLFCVIFIPSSGIVHSPGITLKTRVREGIAFWGFFTFNAAIYSYSGQLFMCLVRGPGTATVLCSIFIGINNFFSGFVVLPQQMVGGFWEITYWICPGHFVYEGLVMSVFHADTVRNVIVGDGSDYYPELCIDIPANVDDDGTCEVNVSTYVDAFFGGYYQRDNIMRNAIILGCILALVRFLTFVALRYLTYSGK